ncbi:MAG: hypothetical protein WB676_04795 [Bryobacteraceae bacterium]
MATPRLLLDLAALLANLGPYAAVIALILAAVALRREGGLNFALGGGFMKWLFWAVVLITLPQILLWFSNLGIGTTTASGVSTTYLSMFQQDLQNFVTQLVVGRIIPVLAAACVLKAVIDGASGQNPLASILAALFLLSIPTTLSVLQSYNSGSQFATADVLDSIWDYVAGRIFPTAAALALIGAILCFATRRAFGHLVFSALGFLSVTSIWKLVQSMM